jgi:hypothetical protein
VTGRAQVDAAELREDWLSQLAKAFESVIADRAGVSFPPYRVTCGFPSKGGELGKKTRTRGQCWSASASEDQHAEIFISPVEDDPATVAAILAHEMLHAAMPEAGHKRPFQIAAAKIGHCAPFTSSEPTPDFMAWAAPIIAQLAPYPHRRLNALSPVAQKKKQTGRMLKCECSECGYTVRTARKWLEERGAPFCGTEGHPRMTHEPLDIEDGEGGDDDGA